MSKIYLRAALRAGSRAISERITLASPPASSVGHIHVHIDDTGWWWADASGLNTIDVAGLKPGEHKVRIDLVNANHQTFPGQTKTVTFTVPESARNAHLH